MTKLRALFAWFASLFYRGPRHRLASKAPTTATRWRYMADVFPCDMQEAIKRINRDHPTWDMCSIYVRVPATTTYGNAYTGGCILLALEETVVIHREPVEPT